MSATSFLTQEILLQFDRQTKYLNFNGSFSSKCSTSSSLSSTSSSSSSSSSSSTSAKFSSDNQSFSSQSTIVAAQPRPFGLPEYNYFWIENESKSNSKISYYYNIKSHNTVWQRPCPKDVPLPYYKSTWGFVEPHFSDYDEEIFVSDSENILQRRKRLKERQRNRRLMEEDINDEIKVVKMKKVIKSKRSLDTFWKLYRYPGESLEDVKKRLLDSTAFEAKVKQEMVAIKEEVGLENQNYPISQESIDQTIKALNNDSDSDPEHVSFFIKQEYLMNYNIEDSEEEYAKLMAADDNEVAEELRKDISDESEEESEDSSENLANFEEHEQEELDQFQYIYEAPCLFTDLFEIEINVNDKECKIVPPEILIKDDLIKQEINWNFEKTFETPEKSSFTQSIIQSIYEVPKLKQLTSKGLKFKRKNKSQKKKTRSLMRKIKTELEENVNLTTLDYSENQPIVCDMYGIRTINYNYSPLMKIPRRQGISNLSDSSDDSNLESSIFQIKQDVSITNESAAEKNGNSPLKLISWFPKRKNRKRKIISVDSDESWYASVSSSQESDLEKSTGKSRSKQMKIKNESLSPISNVKIKEERLSPEPSLQACVMSNLTPIKIKEERLSPEPATNVPNYSHPFDMELNIAVDSIKQEVRSCSSSLELLESEKPVSMTSTLLLDSSIAKVERYSPVLERDFGVVTESENNAKVESASDSDSDSSSTSCSCSRSSCCSGSSGSSGSDDGDFGRDRKVKKEIS